MPLFADGPMFVIGWETGVALATGLTGAVTAAVRMLVNYHTAKDAEHRKQVSEIVTAAGDRAEQQHADCQKDKEILIGVVQTFNRALGELKADRQSKP